MNNPARQVNMDNGVYQELNFSFKYKEVILTEYNNIQFVILFLMKYMCMLLKEVTLTKICLLSELL